MEQVISPNSTSTPPGNSFVGDNGASSVSGNNKTVIVGMSGGVDSSVAALLLKQQGYKVVGMFMKNWEETDGNGNCLAAREYQDVVKVCQQIDIPYYSVDFIKEYRQNVFSHFLAEYRQGHTPNPDILCNREIKFKAFFNKAMELGADYLATGHFVQSAIIDGEYRLLKGVDPNKDQSYFLYTIKKEILEKVLFPVGGMSKKEVRNLARQHNLATQSKKDSTGICFIGERNFTKFLANYIPAQTGNFENLAGEVVGQHQGVAFYTLGQRKGLGLGGAGRPWFVVGKDIERNVVLVERGDDHPILYRNQLIATEASWVAGRPPENLPYRCRAKIRYRQDDQDCVIESLQNDQVQVSFSLSQRAVTPRQSIVFYQDDICLGGAIITADEPF